MDFKSQLNEYIKIINCSGKALSDASSIPAPIISEYRKGNRTPKCKSEQLDNLIKGLANLAKKNKITDLSEKIIRSNLEKTLNTDNIDFEVFRNNFNLLITTLKINVSDLAKYIGFDSSFISKIKSGIRKPSNLANFSDSVCKFIINNHFNDEIIKELIKCEYDDLSNYELMHTKLYTWLTNNNHIPHEEYDIDNFVKKLDDFDLNNYIKAIKFDKLFVPTLPKLKTKSQCYYGLDGYKEAQLDVLKQAALFKSKEEIFWYNNMSMIEASKDLKFTKKYMMYLAFILKKGIKLNVVHDLDRPFKELMLGLEGWIPLYMTGKINPYYFKNNSNFLYSVIECVSGNAILHGECVTGNIENCKLLISSKKDDIDYYRQNSKLLLKKANPLMSIYTKENSEEFKKIINSNLTLNKSRRNILLDLPCYTISDELLDKILNRNNINTDEKEIIHRWIEEERSQVKTILKKSEITDEIIVLSKEEFENNKHILDLSKFFYDKKIIYTYEEYKEHLNLLKEFKKNNANYNYKKLKKNIFKNINISIIDNKQVIISKTNAPITHFVIYHPILVDAIQNFKVQIKEKDYI